MDGAFTFVGTLIELFFNPVLCSGLCEHPRHNQTGERRKISHSQEEILSRVLQQSLLIISGQRLQLLPAGSELQLSGARSPAAAAVVRRLSFLPIAAWQWRRRGQQLTFPPGRGHGGICAAESNPGPPAAVTAHPLRFLLSAAGFVTAAGCRRLGTSTGRTAGSLRSPVIQPASVSVCWAEPLLSL